MSLVIYDMSAFSDCVTWDGRRGVPRGRLLLEAVEGEVEERRAASHA